MICLGGGCDCDPGAGAVVDVKLCDCAVSW